MDAHYQERYLILSGIGPKLQDCAYPNPFHLGSKIFIYMIYAILESCSYMTTFQGHARHIYGGTYSFKHIVVDKLDGVVSI